MLLMDLVQEYWHNQRSSLAQFIIILMSQKSGKRLSADSIFLGKYISKSKLGKGAFGDVFLVQAEKQQFALKIIDKKKMIGENEHLFDYLQGEVACMKEIDYKHIVELHDFVEDEDYFYMVLEYCNGGDLMNLQATQPNKVFSLEKATQYLSQVILGLEVLHKRGYLHRDIKPQNVLVKTVNNEKIFKIADFGFTKKAKNVEGTVLGTQQYMAPEIYKQGVEQLQQDGQKYGYEVDMWAFGVLLFYMLNLSYPFEINPYWTIDVKYKELRKQAEEFSYRKAVANTRKKVLQNCTDEVEDLFRKMFRIDQQKRINFSQIRQHPVFSKWFPKPSPQSQILYISKFKSTIHAKKKQFQSNVKLMSKVGELSRQKLGIPSTIYAEDQQKTYAREKLILSLLVQQIKFLPMIVDEIQLVQQEIGLMPTLMFAFNLIKYHIVLFKDFIGNLSAQKYTKKYPGHEWTDYFATPQFAETKRSYALDIHRSEMKYKELYIKCKGQYKQLCVLNDSFGNSFDEEITEVEFQGQFFRSYRKSTDIIYSKLKEYLKTKKILKFYYFLCVVCICHVFSDLQESYQLKLDIFSSFLLQVSETSANEEKISYEKLAHYLRNSQKPVLLKLAKKIIDDIMMMKK